MSTLEKIFEKSKAVVLDSGVLLEYFKLKNQPLNRILNKFIFHPESKITLYGHHLLKSEIYYIICRYYGENQATETLNHIDEVMVTISEKWIYELAGKIKCNYPISLPDCYSISLGILHQCPIFFMPERELPEERIKKINQEFGGRITSLKQK